jgi:hypothetical protein
VKYAPFNPSDTTHTITVSPGNYQESTWEIPSGKAVSVIGSGKSASVLTVGSQNFDGFVICTSGFFFFYCIYSNM